MRGWLLIGLVGCTPGGGGGDAYVLADGDARRSTLRIDGEDAGAAMPIAVAPGSVLEAGDEQLELGPDEVALVQGGGGQVWLYVLGVDVEPGLVEATGPEDRVTALADDLGVDLEETATGWVLGDPDIWPLLASAEPVGRVTFRPVSAEDLPGTAPLGHPDPVEVRRTSALSALLGGAPTSAITGEARRARMRAEALFSLEPGAPELSAGEDARRGAWLVGRYCAGREEVTLGASGQATVCDDGDCDVIPWSVDGEDVVVDGRFAIEPSGRGQRLLGQDELVDLVIGGCP
jgi:hypothetical protein